MVRSVSQDQKNEVINMENSSKEIIANTCEKLYMYCISVIPQVENNKLIWFLNGSTLCNVLYNVRFIDGVEVSDEFNNFCKDFVRLPKGDIDITYTPDRRYKFDLNNPNIVAFQEISEEQRTYNFVDSNSELNETDLEQICKMTTKNGFVFYAKKPQYLFLYKLKEFIAIFNKEILENNIDEINRKKKNMLNDVKNLYNISVSYCGYEQTLSVINNLTNISGYLHNLYEENKNDYDLLLNTAMNLITNVEQKIRR